NKGRVRENYKIIDRKSMLTEVNDVSSEVPEEKQIELVDLIRKLSADSEAIVISGGLAKGMEADFYYKVLCAAPQSVIKVVDSEGERLLQALKCGVDLVKPNLSELENTLQRKITGKEDMLTACREILDNGAKYVLLSLGKQGAVITDGNKSFHCKSVNVAMNSTIGAGDGMVAAATNALVKGGNMEEILRCGVAGGTAAVTSPDSISFTKEKYQEILSSLTVEEI
ncbi:MAG: bifunctional hydroxymethylpyrimidine kinase/phosphomethylpyrimidine kinase, partial [Clostridia bacterium]|nr:bifunctional hydroxymethylpyrimidine kinase/phosphomethylpyrimidine kinase [Clostridia bacterium]